MNRADISLGPDDCHVLYLVNTTIQSCHLMLILANCT